jgi:hypothetical protein
MPLAPIDIASSERESEESYVDFGAVFNQSGGACGAARAALVQLTLIVQLVKHGEPRCCLELSAARLHACNTKAVAVSKRDGRTL